MISVKQLRDEALILLRDVADGEALSEMEAALIDMAVHASPSTLDFDRAETAGRRALAAGASPEQLHEVLVLLSALGVHTLMVGSPIIGALAMRDGHPAMTAPLDEAKRALWDRHVGHNRYWQQFELAIPGFLEALLRQSPSAFGAFFGYCALPWENPTIPPKLMELISLAVDISPTHRFGPGFRLHLRNALKLGVGRTAIMSAIDIAAVSGTHQGID